ncbi:MAG: RluA family pseudouridine synthase [Planctomycetota bacterium]
MSRPPEDQAPLVLRSRVGATGAGQPLLAWLAARFPYLTAAAWRAEVERHRIAVDGHAATTDTVLRAGNEVAWTKIAVEPYADLAVAVLHADGDLVVADKPAHLPMHADGPFVRATLVHVLRQRPGFAQAALVHRLDRETSGLCVLALTARARTGLAAQFAAGEVAKAYHAVVRGHVAGDIVVDAPIGHARASMIQLRRACGAAAVAAAPARTRFVVLERGPAATLLRCEPTTGRAHQIRVHAEHLGHPLLGDKLYGRPDADYLAFVTRVKASGDAREVAAGEPDRHLLHASALAFRHPGTGAALAFESPPPASFRDWLLREPPGAGGSQSPDAAGSMPA